MRKLWSFLCDVQFNSLTPMFAHQHVLSNSIRVQHVCWSQEIVRFDFLGHSVQSHKEPSSSRVMVWSMHVLDQLFRCGVLALRFD